ncbi:MAG: hypothetical protein ACK417_02585 [Bacteroidia bacterium]
MPTSAKYFLVAGAIVLLLSACRRDEYHLYEVNPVPVEGVNYGKNKQKTTEQYIAILHANLFQRALSANQQVEISNLIESIGDKQVAFEMVVSNFMNRPDVIIPSMQDMRSDVDAFIVNTYRRFLIRLPTEAEKAWFRNFIETNTFVTPEIVYLSFALCDEYQYY